MRTRLGESDGASTDSASARPRWGLVADAMPTGSSFRLEGERLHLEQPSGAAVGIDQSGLSWLSTDVSHRGTAPGALTVILEEELTETLARAYRLASSLLDLADQRRLITHVLPVTVLDRDHTPLRTKEEHAASPSSMSIAMAPERLTADWPRDPMTRPALRREADALAANVVAQFRTMLAGR